MKIQSGFWDKIKRLYAGPVKNAEDDYYEKLFIQDSEWNSQDPNEDEQCRLVAIKEHLNFGGIDTGANRNILDVGCGRGWLTETLSAYGQVVGIDPVEKVVRYAAKLFPRLTFFHGTPQEYQEAYPGKKFDLIVSSEVIEHVPDSAKKDFVDTLSALLAERGHIIITTPRQEVQAAYLQEYGEPDQPVEEWMTEEEVVSLFEGSGFRVLNHINVGLPYSKTLQEAPVYQTWLFQKSL